MTHHFSIDTNPRLSYSFVSVPTGYLARSTQAVLFKITLTNLRGSPQNQVIGLAFLYTLPTYQ